MIEIGKKVINIIIIVVIIALIEIVQEFILHKCHYQIEIITDKEHNMMRTIITAAPTIITTVQMITIETLIIIVIVIIIMTTVEWEILIVVIVNIFQVILHKKAYNFQGFLQCNLSRRLWHKNQCFFDFFYTYNKCINFILFKKVYLIVSKYMF